MSDDEAKARLGNYLSHMLEAAQLARQYVQGVSKDEFLTDRRTQQAVVLNLMTIGEAAARIVNECKEFATAHPEIPWGADARHAQSHGSQLFRRRPKYRVGHGSKLAAAA
jgi:uncharacterized protein with HEPN domain